MIAPHIKSPILAIFLSFPFIQSASAQESHNDQLEELTIDHLRAGFAAMSFDQLAKPGRRAYPHPNKNPISWLDSVASLRLSPETETEIVTLIRSSPGYRPQPYLPVTPPSAQRWLEARFHEIRNHPQKALALLQSQEIPALNSREKIALGRLLFLQQDEKKAGEVLTEVTDWSELRAELHVFTLLAKIEKLPSFFQLLERTLTGTDYRKNIYSHQLDLAFQNQRWQEALVEAKAKGPLWQLFALHHYGETSEFEKLLVQLQAAKHPLRLEELRLYQLPEIQTKLIERLLSGKGQPSERLTLVQSLQGANQANLAWLPDWISSHPDEVRSMALQLAVNPGRSSLTPTIEESENPFTEFLSKEPWDPNQGTTLARLVMIQSFRHAAALIDYLRTARCQERHIHSPLADTRKAEFIATLEKEDPLALVLLPSRPALPKKVIWEALQKNPSFQALSKAGQARYLLIANLERPLLNTLPEVDWSEPFHHPLAYATAYKIETKTWPNADRLLQVSWLNQFLGTQKEDHLNRHLEWWAAQITKLKLPPGDQEKSIREVIILLSENHKTEPAEVLTQLQNGIQSSPKIMASLTKIRGEEIKSAAHFSRKLGRDRLLGQLALNAATHPAILSATGDHFQGIWQTAGGGDYSVTPSYFRNLRHLNWFMFSEDAHWTAMGGSPWTKLAANLQRHLIPPAEKGPRSFLSDWVQYQLLEEDSAVSFHTFLANWKGKENPDIILGKLLIAPMGRWQDEKPDPLLAQYSRPYLKSLWMSRKRIPRIAIAKPLMDAIERRVSTPKSILVSENRPAPAMINRILEQRKIDDEGVREFFSNAFSKGRSISDLARSLDRFREFASLEELGKLLKNNGSNLRRQDSKRDWDEEVMTYLETIDPRELYEIGSASQLPMVVPLASHPKYAERYFKWAHQADQIATSFGADLGYQILKKNDPETFEWGIKWLEETVIRRTSGISISHPSPSAIGLTGSSSSVTIWEKLQELGLLQKFADRVLPRLSTNLNERLTLLLLASSTQPESQASFLQIMRAQRNRFGPSWSSNGRNSFIRRIIQASDEGYLQYANLQKMLFNDPALRSGVDLIGLLHADPGVPVDQVLRQFWKSRANVRLDFLDRSILGVALTEGSDETFRTILHDFQALEGGLDYTYTWEDLMRDYQLAKPLRLKLLLDHLLKEGRLAKLRNKELQEEVNWMHLAHKLLQAAHRCQHKEVITALSFELALYLGQKQKISYMFEAADADRLALFAKTPPAPVPIINQVTNESNKTIIAWSLIGQPKSEDGVIFDSSIKALDKRYTVTLRRVSEQGALVNIASLKAAPTQGSFQFLPSQIKPGDQVILEVTSVDAAVKDVWASRLLTLRPRPLAVVSLAQKWNFRATDAKGPFGIRRVWRGRFFGDSNRKRKIEIARWDLNPAKKLNFSFWLNRGSSRHLTVKVHCLDSERKVIKEISLRSVQKNPLIRGGWQEALFLQADHKIPEETNHLALVIERRAAAFAITRPVVFE